MSFLSEELRQRIQAYLPRYPSKQAVTLPALHLVHDELRCVPREAIREIADLLDLGPAEVHDAMSFYEFFREQHNPLGKTRLWVCRSLACALRGGDELLSYLCQRLGVPAGGTTADGKITLEFGECVGACELAPCILANDKKEGPLPIDRPDVADKLVRWSTQLRGNELASPALLESIRQHGRMIRFAVEGSEERRLLQACQANASVGGEDYNHLVLQDDARKIEALEEFLHGTQQRLGLLATAADTVDAE